MSTEFEKTVDSFPYQEGRERGHQSLLFAIFPMARSRQKKPVYGTARSKRCSHYLIIMGFGTVLH